MSEKHAGYRHYRSRPTPEWFQKPVMARYVRVYPLEWHGYPGGRMSVMICGKCGEGTCEPDSLTNKQELKSVDGYSGGSAKKGTYIISPNARFVLQMQVFYLPIPRSCHPCIKSLPALANRKALLPWQCRHFTVPILF